MNTTPDREAAQSARSEHAVWLAAARCGEQERITLPTRARIIRATRLNNKSRRTVQRDREKGRTALRRPIEEA